MILLYLDENVTRLLSRPVSKSSRTDAQISNIDAANLLMRASKARCLGTADAIFRRELEAPLLTSCSTNHTALETVVADVTNAY